MTLDDVIKLITQVGVPTALCLFFVWRDYFREKDTKAEQKAMREFINVKLITMVEATTAALAANTAASVACANSYKELESGMELLVDGLKREITDRRHQA